MDLKRLLALALDPSLILAAQGMAPDPWQREMLLCPARHVLLNCSRGAGKTRVTSALALHTALFEPGALVLLVSRAQRQAGELLRYCKQGNRALGRPVRVLKENEHLLEFTHGSRIISLPGKEETIRSFQGVRLLVLDEAARVPDDLYGSVSPMTGTAQGRTVCLSTPFGQRGFFWREWFADLAPWVRFRVPWQRCPRLSEDFIAEERRKFGDGWIAQEYECDFRSVEGLVYPDFEKCLTDRPAPVGEGARLVGGIDFGFRNPFAALWGVLDRDGVLHITAERYLRETPLHEHARALPPGVMWYADPAGRTEIEELLAAGHKVRRGPNDIRPGIAAVTARIRTGGLKVHAAACPNLLAEARLYRYPTEAERAHAGENPVDDNNHALAALRYLIGGIDARTLARPRPGEEGEPGERRGPRAEPQRPRDPPGRPRHLGDLEMRQLIANTLTRLASWVRPKGIPTAVAAGAARASSFLDSYRKHREPSPRQLLEELKNTAWSCASINSAVCASCSPRLYVTTTRGQTAPKCLTKGLHHDTEARLRSVPHLAAHVRGARAIEEVVEHPLLTLLRQVNPVNNAFELWELTQLYLEVHGAAYWLLQDDESLGIPTAIWILPSQNVTPRRLTESSALVDFYEYRSAVGIARYAPDEVIRFQLPDPRDPYTGGLSPLRACFEQVALASEYAAMKRAVYDNTGVPSVVLSPAEVIGADERDRLEEQWERKFRRGGSGKVLVAESGVRVDLLSHSMGDLAALADMKATKEDIANAFHCPLPFLSGDTNLANMQAADHLHKSLAIVPRLRRRDEKLNEQLIPRYDPSGRLFLASDDPTPDEQDRVLRQRESDLRFGVRTINEIRSERGLPPVPWGDRPFRFEAGGTAPRTNAADGL